MTRSDLMLWRTCSGYDVDMRVTCTLSVDGIADIKICSCMDYIGCRTRIAFKSFKTHTILANYVQAIYLLHFKSAMLHATKNV